MTKYKKVLKILGVALALGLLLMAVPAAPALAATTITAENVEGSASTNPNYGDAVGKIGDKVKVSGTATAYLQLYICLSSQNAEVNDYIDEEVTTYEWFGGDPVAGVDGDYSTEADIPSKLDDGDDDLNTLHEGKYYFYVAPSTMKILAKTEFYITGIAEITGVDPDSGPVGTEVQITGSGFSPEEGITVEYDGVDMTDEIVVEGEEETNVSGAFDITISIPESINGDHTITIVGEESLAELVATFTVEPKITLSAASGLVGATITINGTGFAKRNGVVFAFGSSSIAPVWLVESSGRTNSSGTFAVQITVPELAPGSYTIKATDEDKSTITAQTTFAVTAPPLEPAITISPASGQVGATVTITGTEFANSKAITLSLDGVTVTPAAAITSSATGTVTGSFVIPESTYGAHTLKVQDSAGNSATTTLTVRPKITMTPTTGSAGTEVTVTGTGFAGQSDITVEFDGDDVDIDGDDSSDTKGSFEFSFVVPAAAAGGYDVTIEDAGGNNAEMEFTVTASSVAVSPTTGIGGTTVTVSGTNFLAGSTVTITFNNEAITTNPAAVTAGSTGSFSATFTAPAKSAGSYDVKASDGFNSASATFAVTATATMTPTSGSVGEAVAVSGTGFGASRTITITYDGTAVTTASPITTGADGSFSGSFNAPASAGGNHTVNVSDGTNSKQFTFAMETSKPSTPQQQPLGTDRPKQPITFDWSDVTDASMPVTYGLQIASDSSFTNLVLNKSGLTASQYTLTEAEKLEPTSGDNPYYWRVRSTDAASNNSDWGPSATFYISGGFPSWLMWTLIGVGAFIVFIFAIWLGRRIAFSSY